MRVSYGDDSESLLERGARLPSQASEIDENLHEMGQRRAETRRQLFRKLFQGK